MSIFDKKCFRKMTENALPFRPSKGDIFRVRIASLNDRSYLGDIWECLGYSNGCIIAEKVMDAYSGVDSRHIGNVRSFVYGDVECFNCNEAWRQYKELDEPVATQYYIYTSVKFKCVNCESVIFNEDINGLYVCMRCSAQYNLNLLTNDYVKEVE